MSCFNRAILFLPIALSAGNCFAQNQNAPQPKALASTLLTRAHGAIAGGNVIQDVVLTGTVRRVAGSTDETGQAELKALVTGEARLDLAFPSGPLSEVYAQGAHGPVGEWSGADRMAHAAAYHNMLVDAAWFSPALVLQRANAASANRTITAVGRTTVGGRPLDRLRVASPPRTRATASSATPGLPQKVAGALQKASEFDLYLDFATSLPAEMDFQTHPDSNLGQDIPVRIRYLDYRTVNGIQVPFHVQKFLNGTLSLDLQFDSASFNTGLTGNSFVVTAQAPRSLPQ